MVAIIKNLCPEEKYPLKCPFELKPKFIVIHNTANDASARNEISYMLRRPEEVSFHFAVDDKEIVQGIPLERNAWHAGDGNGKGNREGIAIEICYSKSGGSRWEAALKNAAELTAMLMKQYRRPIELVTTQPEYSGKRCPHRILDEYGWDNFLELIKSYHNPADSKPLSETPEVIYAAHLKNGSWLEDVRNYNESNADGYAGITNRPIDGIRASLTRGDIVYRVHTIGGKYLNWVKNLGAAEAGYAGLYGKDIDGVQMYIAGIEEYAVEYRVSLTGKGYLPWVRNYKADTADGYAGIYGKAIDRIQIRIVKI